MHIHIRIAMLAVEDFEKKCEIVAARRTQPEVFNGGDFLLQSEAQLLFLEGLLTPKFNDARVLRSLFLLFHDRLPCFLPFFGSRNIDGALRCDFKYQGQTAKTEQDPVPHLRSLLKYPATPRESGLGWMARRERRAC